MITHDKVEGSFLVTICSLLAKKTEGFSPKDLQSLLDRAFHRAAVRKMKQLPGIERFFFSQSLPTES